MPKFMIKVLLMGLVLSTTQMPTADAKVIIPKPHESVKSYGVAKNKKVPVGEELNLLVWNIYKGGKDSFGQDYKRLSKNVDFLVLQEMTSDPEIFNQTVFNKKEYEHHFAVSFFRGAKQHGTGVGTHSTYRANRLTPVLSPGREPVVKTPKMALFTQYLDENGRELLIINVHSLNFVSTDKWQAQLLEIATLIKNHKGPAIFAGDFNTWNDKRLNILHDVVVRRLGFTALFKTYNPEGRMAFAGRPLDHLFYRGVKYLEHDVLEDVKGSDHKAISFKFHL
jgi:endonuclease/exonuclease/phosphatase (EEP) superfamily protein YafD